MWFEKAYAGTISLPQASTIAAKIDNAHDFIFWMSVFFLVIVTVALIIFTTKFHTSKKGRQTEYILGSHVLETIWTVVPLILMLFIFGWGYVDYLELRKEFKDPVEINVVGRQWLWNMEYQNGRKTMNELVVPKGKPVKVIMTSDDVLHSFFIPNFRLKQDVVPGMYTYISFIPTIVGSHPIFCTEYCGTGHSDMLGTTYVLEPQDFDSWLETGRLPAGMKSAIVVGEVSKSEAQSQEPGKPQSLASQGKALFEGKGCFACHSTDGTAKVGPTLLKAFGRNEEMQDGSKITVDENYLRESILQPQVKVVKGFAPSMPPFQGQLSEADINALIAYIKSLK